MTKHSHKCQNEPCPNTAAKDNYGNYKRYCCDACMLIGRKTKHAVTANTRTQTERDTITNTRRATTNKKYGVSNVAQTKTVKDKLSKTTKATAITRTAKTIATNLKNHGVESTNSLQSVKDLKVSNYKEKTGFDHPLKSPTIAASVSKKNTDNSEERLKLAGETKKERYGDKNYNNREKYIETCLERFGVENPSQNAEIHAKKMKSEYRTKLYVFPSGRKIRVQGYEGKAIDKLLLKYKEEDIVTGALNIPFFRYVDQDDKNHVYFPDIYIPKDNLIIEVKSEYTYKGYAGWYVTNMLKKKSCLDAGFNFEFMIMSKK